jgi:DNA-binding LacI/PurR family transcriptional regulator
MAKRNLVPTVREVAARCGVSVATVSRVLNSNYSNGFSVRKELRGHITQVADELGYRPNIAAKNLVQRQTKIVAMLGNNTVFGWPSNIYQTTIEAAVRYFQAHDFDICSTAPNLERDVTELPPWRVDGIVVIQECSQKTIEEMEKTHLPYVVVNGTGGPSASQVMPDDIEATRRAIGHLYSLGHRRIAYAGPTPEHRQHMSIRNRHDTYVHELETHGLACISGHDTLFQSAPDFLAQTVVKEHATAILTYDHVVAMKILHDAPLYNIQIPEQVSLMCFNDEYFCDIVKPSLTTMGIPSRQMGELAAQLLLKQIETPEENRIVECIKLPEELTIRASTVKFVKG